MNKDYYSRQLAESDEISQNKLNEKQIELEKIFKEVPFTAHDNTSLAVLGCGDIRHLEGNKKIFEEVLGVKVNLTTFDLETEHLEGGAKRHDCTLPLPDKFDITYAHVLLKFIEPGKQTELIKNSYDALNNNGLAIHVLDNGDKEVGSSTIFDYLKEENINYKQIPLKYGFALVLIKS